MTHAKLEPAMKNLLQVFSLVTLLTFPAYSGFDAASARDFGVSDGAQVAFGSAIGDATLQTPEPEPNFAVRFDHKGCHWEYLDTFRGTYSHIGAKAPVRFAMTPDQKWNLYQAILRARFFDLPPRVFGKSVNPNPSDVYELEVLNGRQRNRVSWAIGHLYGEEHTRIMGLHRSIFDLLDKHPDVLRLPKRGDGCLGGPPPVR